MGDAAVALHATLEVASHGNCHTVVLDQVGPHSHSISTALECTYVSKSPTWPRIASHTLLAATMQPGAKQRPMLHVTAYDLLFHQSPHPHARTLPDAH